MKNKHQNLHAWRKSKGCTIDCTINLNLLFEEKEERKRFDAKWKDFVAFEKIPLLCVPPTRLAGPCCQALIKIVKDYL